MKKQRDWRFSVFQLCCVGTKDKAKKEKTEKRFERAREHSRVSGANVINARGNQTEKILKVPVAQPSPLAHSTQ